MSDYSNDITTKGLIDVGGVLQGNIEVMSDKDQIKVHLEANKYYQIDLEGLNSNADTFPLIE